MNIHQKFYEHMAQLPPCNDVLGIPIFAIYPDTRKGKLCGEQDCNGYEKLVPCLITLLPRRK